jgi:pimeloyl-ACP methyl ester carboxylesterase
VRELVADGPASDRIGSGSALRKATVMAVPARLVDVAIVAAMACLVLAGCSAGTAADGSAVGTTLPPAGTVSPDRDFSGLIDLGGGRVMHLECSGTGAPTVVLISGTGNAGDVWREARPAGDPTGPISQNDDAVFPRTARTTRVCAYDRPGTERSDGSPGGSSAVPQPTTTQDDAADLHALLTAAGVPGSFVLVAHSLGGLIATTYARTYPHDVSGLVLIDPASQFMETTMGPSAWRQYVEAALSRATTGAETIDPDASDRAIDALPGPPRVPAAVLSSDRPWFILPFGEDGAMVDYSSELRESQTLLATSIGATQVTKTNSAHDLYIDNAPLVNEQICAVIGRGKGC